MAENQIIFLCHSTFLIHAYAHAAMDTTEDFNIVSEERHDLLVKIQELSGGVKVSPQLWATLQVCDIDVLKSMTKAKNPIYILDRWETDACRLVLTWRQRDPPQKKTIPTVFDSPLNKQQERARSVSETDSPAQKRPMTQAPDTSPQHPSPLLAGTRTPITQTSPAAAQTPRSSARSVASGIYTPRSMAMKINANIRDSYRCIVTRQGQVESAHILPYSILKDNEKQQVGRRSLFWGALESFWGLDWLEKAQAIVGSPDDPLNLQLSGHETIRNIISLTNSAHALWNNGYFALKPDLPSDDGTSMCLRIFWQAKQQCGPDGRLDISTKAESTKGRWITNHGAFLTKAIGKSPGDIKSLVSGDVIQITTPNPIKYPLPSYELLRLQWYLTRIVGMAGAAEVDSWIDPRDHPEVDAIHCFGEGEWLLSDESSVFSREDLALSDIPDFVLDMDSSGLNESPVKVHTAGTRLPLQEEESKDAAGATRVTDVAEGGGEVH